MATDVRGIVAREVGKPAPIEQIVLEDPGPGEVLVRVLKHTGGNQLQAARILGITRGSLRTKIRALGISIARSVWSDDDQGDS